MHELLHGPRRFVHCSVLRHLEMMQRADALYQAPKKVAIEWATHTRCFRSRRSQSLQKRPLRCPHISTGMATALFCGALNLWLLPRVIQTRPFDAQRGERVYSVVGKERDMRMHTVPSASSSFVMYSLHFQSPFSMVPTNAGSVRRLEMAMMESPLRNQRLSCLTCSAPTSFPPAES